MNKGAHHRQEHLLAILEEARSLGFLGPGPVEAHLAHAAGFAEVVLSMSLLAEGAPAPARGADLGSGPGLPGLPLALRFGRCAWALVESSVRRAQFLRSAVDALELHARVQVVEERAERVGRDPAFRGRFDLVVARSFGAPAVMAECAAPLLRVGGRAVVSEPPGGNAARWPEDGLAMVGMTREPAVSAHGATYQVLVQAASCPAAYPRPVGRPAKRPLF